MKHNYASIDGKRYRYNGCSLITLYTLTESCEYHQGLGMQYLGEGYLIEDEKTNYSTLYYIFGYDESETEFIQDNLW